MNKKINVLTAVFFMVLLFATTGRAETFFAYLNGAQEVPPAATNGTGYARVFLNETAGSIQFTIVFNNLTGAQTLSHIHTGGLGVSGPIAINLGTAGGTSGTISGNASITPSQITQLRAHQFYVNVHSGTFSGGEIRGQLGVKRPVDFDGDGRQDLSVLRFPNVPPPAVAQITYYNRNSTSGDSAVIFGDANTDFPAPGDYDGDGLDDVCVYRAGATAGAQSFYYILRSSDGTAQVVSFGVSGDHTVNRDYDGDGITDVAIFRRGAAAGTQAVWWIRRSGSGNAFSPTPWGTTGDGVNNFDTPIPGDYDGDGKFDLAVYRFALTPANNFIILRSSDGAATYKKFGNFDTDFVLPGDYDGDGKYDYAIARTGAQSSSPLVWWIENSSNGATTATTFGITSDLPAQGDYDGDARADIAVYRRGAGATGQSNFWIRSSFTGLGAPIQWGLGSDFALNTFDTR